MGCLSHFMTDFITKVQIVIYIHVIKINLAVHIHGEKRLASVFGCKHVLNALTHDMNVIRYIQKVYIYKRVLEYILANLCHFVPLSRNNLLHIFLFCP